MEVLTLRNMHDIPNTHDVNIQDHVNSMNPTKPWFKLLQFSLQKDLKTKEHYLSFHLKHLKSDILELKRWCVPHRQIRTSGIRYHVKLYVPCGYVQIASEIEKNSTSWKIEIPVKMRVQVNFLVFEMDVSHRGCEQSAFYLLYHDFSVSQWIFLGEGIFCGYRKPWYETAPSSAVSMFLRHRNVQQRSNITFTYTSLERGVANVYIMHANISQHMVLYPVIVKYDVAISHDVRNWLLVADYGFKLHVSSLFVCCSENRVVIYDGSQENFSVRYKKKFCWRKLS